MTLLSPISEHFESQTEAVTTVEMLECERFGWCAKLSANTTSTIGSASAENLDGGYFTSSLWVKLDDISAVLEFLVGNRGWSLKAGGKLQLTDSASPSEVSITVGNWHHICWIKGKNKQSLYLDGQLINTASVGFTAVSSDSVVFKTAALSVQMAHQHNYARALSIPEVLVDQMMYFEPATQSFNDYYPLDVNVQNIEGPCKHYSDNKLFVIDTTADGVTDVKQQLNISNITEKSILLTAKHEATAKNHHFELRIRNAVFAFPSTYPKIASNDNWIINRSSTANSDDGSWSIYMSKTIDTTLKAGESINLDYSYRTADGALGERSTHQLLAYKDLAYEGGGNIAGERNKRLDILNLPSSIVYPLCVSYSSTHGIVFNNTHHDNDITIYVYNRSEQEICFSDQGNIQIKIPFGNTASDFADAHLETGVAIESYIGDTKLGVDEFEKITAQNGALSIFEWTPGQHKKIPSRSFVKFVIKHFVPNSVRGTAFIDVDLNGIDDHGDTTLSLPVTKVDCNLANHVGDQKVGLFTDLTVDGFDFHVARNTYIGANLKAQSLEVVSNLKTPVIQDSNNKKPIIFQKYTLGENSNWLRHYTDSSLTPREYTAAIVGFDSGYGDINEFDSHQMLRVKMVEYEGRWAICASKPTHNDAADWEVNVMFVSRQLSDGY
ncbi:concanavalin A-like lectin/glucanase superfamily protein [Sinobacterium caligoides]|uniref:Concanavalin A-like lectin/glucanase superfamily protein n=1 Tax=Sinobacterium caligoides TaxID=933926 RepID=A0A3N2DPZ8_9GAMM|nr:LamG-like jellyroll fold domain-containing protein [Sinobacterium caligoides]ROS01699.1 concanavalin A-like lectin/glucanase superfamily protein [Sinobacterium caligoides]